MHIAIVTAGGAGMFCGSCMHDNTWAHALIAKGHEVSLIPTYTPLLLDEQNASIDRVFLGGLNVYLNGKFRLWKSVPRTFTRWLDNPALIRWATSFSISNDAAELGELTLSMLQGGNGPHQTAISELARFLKHLKPDVIIFSNALLAGAVQTIKKTCPAPVFCVLQGDDGFLDSLSETYKQQAISKVSQLAQDFDGFFVHSGFYRDHMARYLSLPVDKFFLLPLGIDTDEHQGRPRTAIEGRYVVGYFARMAPEKGLHYLTQAFPLLKEKVPHATLKIGGYQDGPCRTYLEKTLSGLKEAGIPLENIGSPKTLDEKLKFFSEVDVFTVPTQFLESKGMPVLEAMANGVPVVQPAHGAFPEMLNSTGGGLLVRPHDPVALADGLSELANPDLRTTYAHAAWNGVRQNYSLEIMAERTLVGLNHLMGQSS